MRIRPSSPFCIISTRVSASRQVSSCPPNSNCRPVLYLPLASCSPSMTAGYHRLWAHKSYQATLPLKIYLAAVGAGAVEGSIRWWSRDHRAHHRYTDTEKDPYSVRKGLLYSHIGWMVFKQNPKRIGRTDITDLNECSVVVWQHRNYLKSVLFMGLGFPTLVCGLGWGDWLGGFVYGGVLRVCFQFCMRRGAVKCTDMVALDLLCPASYLLRQLARTLAW